jgi:hypothetical protein
MYEPMAYEPEFDVACERNDRTGMYYIQCPLCTVVVTASMEQSAMSRLFDHTYEFHDGGRRVGHA